MKFYILLDFHTNEVSVSRNVILHEHIILYKFNDQSSYTSWSYFPSTTDKSHPINQTGHVTPYQPPEPITLHQPDFVHNIPPTKLTPNINTHFEPDLPHVIITLYHSTNHPVPPIRTSSRVSHHPSYLQDYIWNSLVTLNPSSTGTSYPLSKLISHHKLSPTHSHYSLSLVSNTEPNTYDEAYKHECLKQPM